MSYELATHSAVADLPRPVVFLPGWGFDGCIVELMPAIPPWYVPHFFLDPYSTVAELSSLLDQLDTEYVDLVGWSMGAYLALDFASLRPARVKNVFLLAMRRSWPKKEIDLIRRGFNSRPEQFLQEFYRKCFLGQKQEYRRFVAEIQNRYLACLDKERLLHGLDYLEGWRQPSLKMSRAADDGCHSPNIYLLQGKRDVIAPLEESADVPGSVSMVYEHKGHMLMLGHDFELPQRKFKIRQKFSRAARTYDDHAVVQKKVAEKLVSFLPEPGLVGSGPILEIGCGTGNYTRMLARRFPEADIVALDFAADMINQAQKKLKDFGNIDFICADGERYLDRSATSFKLITSNATFQWFDNPAAAIEKAGHLLSDNGQLIYTIYGPETLKELKEGLRSCGRRDFELPLTRLPDKLSLHGILSKHFKDVDVYEENIIRQYGTLKDLFTHIKMTGTGGWQQTKPILTRQLLHNLDEWFHDQYGRYQGSYQIFLCRGRK